ncbi:MAG: hypothetical protein AAGB06_04980 [Verrucomicrobiota bacterium]
MRIGPTPLVETNVMVDGMALEGSNVFGAFEIPGLSPGMIELPKLGHSVR